MPGYPTLTALYASFSAFRGLQEQVTVGDIDHFVRLASHFKEEIELHAPPNSAEPPYRLPAYIHDLFRACLDLDDLAVIQLWSALKGLIWEGKQCFNLLSQTELREVDTHGMKQDRNSEQLMSIMFYPPVKSCVVCNSPLHRNTLSRHAVTFFSWHNGACRALTSSLSCNRCKIRHYHNYYAQDQLRHYYRHPGVPSNIQLEDHAYIDRRLCEFFTLSSLFAWVSAHNSANIYNHFLTQTDECIRSSELVITSEQVSRAFVLNALLRDCAETGTELILPDTGDNDERLKQATEYRNNRIIAEGQSERMHACGLCEKFIPGHGHNGLRALRAATMDGVTIGRPCCKEHNCTMPLVKHRSHFCALHDHKKDECVVTGCTTPVSVGFRTCDTPEHRAIEHRRAEKGKAWFQLQKRLQKHNTGQLSDSLGNHDYTKDSLESFQDPGKLQNMQVKAHFERRKTNNEQLIVACCGTILARATMFGAESITGVKDFVKSVYPCKYDMPDVLFFDTNCILQSHLQAQRDNYFEFVILPVDVFHFKSKHKETDEFCQKHCNPALWPELSDGNGNWIFNSSIAEQVNVWIGGYQAIVRDMLPHRYDFFLDEMIKRRNQIVITRLRNAGHSPYHVPPHSEEYNPYDYSNM